MCRSAVQSISRPFTNEVYHDRQPPADPSLRRALFRRSRRPNSTGCAAILPCTASRRTLSSTRGKSSTGGIAISRAWPGRWRRGFATMPGNAVRPWISWWPGTAAAGISRKASLSGSPAQADVRGRGQAATSRGTEAWKRFPRWAEFCPTGK